MTVPAEVLLLRPRHPLRSPAWRWELAMALRNMSDRRAPDDAVAEARAFQSGLQVAQTGEQKALLVANLGPDSADAFDFWEAGNLAAQATIPNAPDGTRIWGGLTAEALARAELEALILADLPADKVARHCGLSAAAIGRYEQFWFDVRDRLKGAGWVATHVIGSLHQGSMAMLLPALIRAYGYYTRSARVVKAATGMFDARSARRAGRDPARFFTADAGHAGALKAALVARMLPIHDARVYARVIELHHEALDVESKTKQSGGSEAEAEFREAATVLGLRARRGYGGVPVDAPEVRQLPRLVESETMDGAPPDAAAG